MPFEELAADSDASPGDLCRSLRMGIQVMRQARRAIDEDWDLHRQLGLARDLLGRDVVDAPLDDANVGRFCDIVKSMAEKVQFVFITHNKVTMEMARQLTGVTMQEPGVSRLVSVDLDEAVKMAAS
jgi:hypothetical protein